MDEITEHLLAGRYSWGSPFSRRNDAAVSYCTCGLAFMSFDGIEGADARLHAHWEAVRPGESMRAAQMCAPPHHYMYSPPGPCMCGQTQMYRA